MAARAGGSSGYRGGAGPATSFSGDSFDSSLEAELQMRAGRRQVEMESSVDIDDSYPPPARRMDAGAYRSGASGYGGGSAGGGAASRYSRATDTPSPEPSDVDVSLSASGDYGYGYGQHQSRQPSSVSAASAYPARLSAARSSALSHSGGVSASAARPRRSYAETDSSLEDLNPDNEPEYRPYKPESYQHVSAHELLAQRAAAIKQQQQQQQAAAATSAQANRARTRASEAEEEVEFDLDSSADMAPAPATAAARSAGGARPGAGARGGPVSRAGKGAGAVADHDASVEIDVDDEGEASVDIDVDASVSASLDVRASNNTLIRKAQQMQEDEERKERQQAAAERERKERQRKEAASAAAERERVRLREEEEDRLDREEADRAREEMRRAAEVQEEEEYADEFADEADKPSAAQPASTVATAARGGLDALTLDESAEDEEIERARRQLEEEEEAELAAERRAAEMRHSTSSDGGDDSGAADPQLATAAFMPGSFGVRKASARSGSRSLDDLSLDDSADLDVARRRQEEMEAAEEEEAEQRRREELAAKERQLAAQRRASIEDSYEDEETPAQKATRRHTPNVPKPAAAAAAAASAAPSAPASASSTPTASAGAPDSSASSQLPSVLAAALSTLNPSVSAMVMQAVLQQLANQSGQAPPAPPAPVAMHNPYALYNPAPGQRHPSAVAFDPSQSRAAAATAWERLLNLRGAPSSTASAQVAPASSDAAAAAPAASTVPSHGSFVGRGGGGPIPPGPPPAMLPYPPAPPAHVQSWEDMLAQASSAQLARNAADANQMFARPAAVAATASGMGGPPPPSGYGAPHYPPSSTRYPSGDFQSSGRMGAFIGQVLHAGVAEDRARTHLRVESEREALRRLLAFEPYAAAEAGAAAESGGLAGPSPALARAVADQKALYVQDQAILNSVLRRVLSAGGAGAERAQGLAQLTQQNSLRFAPGANPSAAAAAAVSQGVADDGRPLPANDVIRMIEEGYPSAAYDSWQHMNSNTLARSVLLAADPPSSLYTRNIVEHTLRETLSELLSDQKVIDMCKKATLKKLKHRLQFQQPLQHLSQQASGTAGSKPAPTASTSASAPAQPRAHAPAQAWR